MNKVSQEFAEKEVQRWLDFKRVKPLKREKNKEAISSIVECVMDGTFEINENHEIIHNLAFPLGTDESITQLTYSPRLTIGKISEYTKNCTTNDERVRGYISALSSKSNGLISTMETEDYSSVGNVVIFFF